MLDENRGIYIGDNGNIIELTPEEVRIMELLINNRGWVVSHRIISKEIYRCEPDKYVICAIRLRIQRLRKKFKNEFKIYNRYELGYYII